MMESELNDIVTMLENPNHAPSVTLSEAQTNLLRSALAQLAGDEQTIAILRRRLERYETENAQIDRVIDRQMDHLGSIISSQPSANSRGTHRASAASAVMLKASAEDRANVLQAIDKARNQSQVLGAVLRFVLAAVSAAGAV